MLITVSELEHEPIEFDKAIPAGAIDFGEEAEQVGDLKAAGRADLIPEHRGPKEILADIRLRADYSGTFQVPCARCVEPVEHHIQSGFDLVFRPLGADQGLPDHAISASETEIGYYQGGSLALEDVLREQVLLSLPVRTLCREDCKGLCPHCGQNLNVEACSCGQTVSDPRWSALSEIRSRIKSE
jgi:uncharacterized protein